MDFNQITITQCRRENQFEFDADQFDQAVLRADEYRASMNKFWASCHAFLTGIGGFLSSSFKDGHTQTDRLG